MPSDLESWARLVHSYEEIPQSFKEIAPPELENLSRFKEFPYMILAPEDSWGFRRTNPKLVYLTKDDTVCYLELKGRHLVSKRVPLGSILCLEHGTFLLYSWVKLIYSQNNNQDFLLVEFNSVVEEIFLPFIKTVRQSFLKGPVFYKSVPKIYGDEEKYAFLLREDFKFYNYCRKSLLPEEEVIYCFYQPEVYIRWLYFFKKVICPSHLLLLTRQELILLEERPGLGASSKYGIIRKYIPLNKVDGLRLSQMNIGEIPFLSVEIGLSNNTTFIQLFSPRYQEAFLEMVNKMSLKK